MGVALCRAEFLFGGGEGRKFWSRWWLLGNVNAVIPLNPALKISDNGQVYTYTHATTI